jgi:hypothetical protein
MENLEYLDVEYNELEDIELGSLKERFPKLKSLKTSGNNIKGSKLHELIRELGRLKVNLTDDKIESKEMEFGTEDKNLNTENANLTESKVQNDGSKQNLSYGLLELTMFSLILLVILSFVIMCMCLKSRRSFEKSRRSISDLYGEPKNFSRVTVPESTHSVCEPFYDAVAASRLTYETAAKVEPVQKSCVNNNKSQHRDSKTFVRRQQPIREPMYDNVYELDYHRPRSSVYQCIL